jgi:hypothetical protein
MKRKNINEEVKKAMVKEFLLAYEKNNKLTIRQFSIRKFGNCNSTFFLWVKKYDVNGVYSNRNSGRITALAPTNNPIVKIEKPQVKIKSQLVSVKYGEFEISFPSDVEKESIITFVSSIRSISNGL